MGPESEPGKKAGECQLGQGQAPKKARRSVYGERKKRSGVASGRGSKCSARPWIIPEAAYKLATQSHDSRTERGNTPRLHVDTTAAMFNTSARLRSHNLPHACGPNPGSDVQSSGRNLSRLSLHSVPEQGTQNGAAY